MGYALQLIGSNTLGVKRMSHLFNTEGVVLLTREIGKFITTPIGRTGKLGALRRRMRQKKAKAKRNRNTPVGRFNLQGTVEQGSNELFSIRGDYFEINEDTWVIGKLENGALLEVKGVVHPGGEKVASKVVVLKQ